MDDLKQRLLGFINKQGVYPKPSAVPSREDSCRVADFEQKHSSGNHIKQECSDFSGDRVADQDILETIEMEYFKEEGFDPCRHELKKLGEVICCDEIDRYLQKLRQQQLVVSKQVLQLILQKQNIFGEEFTRVLEIQHRLQTALHICREGRRELNLAKRQFTTASLGILANYRKRQLVQGLLHSLNTIKTLQRTEERLQELLNEGNYPGAISLLAECQGAAATYRHFTCVAALSGKLQDTLEMAEETLDQALARVCSHFDAEHYSRVQAAYCLLGKTQTAMDQLHMHFASAIHNAAFGVVQGYVELCVGDGATQKKQYKQLCENVTPESFIPCLIDLCKALWTVMKSYHQVIGWHQINDVGKLSTAGVTEPVEFEATFNKQYVKQKLENGLARIWHDVQCRICTFLLGSDLTWYKFEEFLQVLAIVHRLMEIGEEFCGSKSEELQDSIKTQSSKYFATYHRERLDELRTFLENESWAPCPVKHDFSILQLQEFRTLRHALLHSSGSTHSQDGSSAAGGDYFIRYAETGSPFDISLEDTQEEDFLANFTDEPSGYFSDESDEDIPEELKKDYVDENAGEVLATTKSWRTGPKKQSRRELLKAPILTNTSLNVLRHCGRYLQMSRLLRPIASTVIACMCQLFDYYLYAVHIFFTSDLVTDLPMTTLYHLKLRASLERIRKELIMPNPSEVDANSIEENKDKVTAPRISPTVDLTQNENLHGLAERVVAVESLIFLAKQLESLESYMLHLQGDSPTTVLQQFFSQTVSAAAKLRQPVYMCVSARAVDLRATLTFMSKVNWEIKDVMSQHSQYVDILLQELQIFSMRLEEVSSRSPIPTEVYEVLWENIFILACNAFVEGFSNAKRCTNGGRGLMQLDFTQFLSKLEKLTTVRPITGRDFVEAYIKAFYLPEKQMEIWLREHKEYTSKQLLALVSCVFQNDKKARNRLIAVIEESVGR